MIKKYLTKAIVLAAVSASITIFNPIGASAKVTQSEAKELVKQNFECVKDYANVADIKFIDEINKSDDAYYGFKFTQYDENLYKFDVEMTTNMYVGVESGKVYLDEGGNISRWFSWIESGIRIKLWNTTTDYIYDENTGHSVKNQYFVKTTGWYKSSNCWRFYKDGVMQTGWIYDNGNWYYCYSNGQMASNTTIDGYKLNSNGSWIN